MPDRESNQRRVPEPASGRGGSRHAPADERRAQILAAAGKAFAERGFPATTMDDIARGAGLSKGSLYWHFRSKRDVFLGVLDDVADGLFDQWDARAASESDVLALLEGFFVLAAETFTERAEMMPLTLEFLRDAECRSRLGEVYRETRERLGVLIDRGVERGQLRELPREALAAALTAGGEGLILQAVVDPDFDLAIHLSTLWDVLRRGIER